MPAGVVEEDMVLFAVPKKGRIFEDVSKLLKGSGLDAKRPERLDVAVCKELPVKLVFLPAADIPSYVMEGNVDLGISGSDMLEEAVVEAGVADNPPIKVLQKLGFGKCRLCLQAPKALMGAHPSSFVGKRIVTSFPALSRRYLDSFDKASNNGRKRDHDGNEKVEPTAATTTGGQAKTIIKVVSGSVEAACGLGLADAVVDLVETGTTMRAAGLEVVSDLMETEALLFQQVPTERNGLAGRKGEIISVVLQRIQGYLTATRYVMVIYNCHDTDLAKCCSVTPGKRSPTITELKETGWHSVSALVEKEKQNGVMDTLATYGAKDILCFNVANTRM
jgi:ATP phosphoribosyltransferase